MSSQDLPIDFSRYIYAFAHESLVRQAADGRLAVLLNGNGASDPGAADPASIGESLYFILDHAEQRGTNVPSPTSAASRTFMEGVDKMLHYIMNECPRAVVNEVHVGNQKQLLLSHRIDGVQIWSDTVYMLPPFLVASAIFHLERIHPRYKSRDLLSLGLSQIVLASEVLQAPTGEWSHIFDLSTRQFKRKAFWGVGNGWVCCGIVRILHMLISATHSDTSAAAVALVYLFRDDAHLSELLRRCYDLLLSTIRACLRHIRQDGLFHDVLDDPSTFVETNLSQQLSYTLYRLLDLDLHLLEASPLAPFWSLPPLSQVDKDGWERAAETMRKAAVDKTDEWGFVRDVCGSPTFDKPGTAAEGQAWGVMMEVVRAEYLMHKRK